MPYPSWWLVLAVAGCYLLVAPPVAGQWQSAACNRSQASKACIDDVQPCLRKILRNITSLPLALTSQSMDNLFRDGLWNGLSNSVGSATAVTNLFISTLGPLRNMVEGATTG
ncbi:hypothetical protein BIW11_11195 [Tropilaelaps mercedesae]|uniref:Secreted protein n=1 Tax=Tropilaelaps mercedesae TaxID=418985 RepID=A0A1V9XCQ6_9ACAR|nr:hypothetical protein BIW11_11195 [Tropilaelaps mercedesae]